MPIGFTSGFGHFHVDSRLFADLREYLRMNGHPYANNNRFGNGPNWRFRAIRAGLELLGFDRDCLHHGIEREVFICTLAGNGVDVLGGRDVAADYGNLKSVQQVSELALERWIVSRAGRRPDFRYWKRERFLEDFDC